MSFSLPWFIGTESLSSIVPVLESLDLLVLEYHFGLEFMDLNAGLNLLGMEFLVLLLSLSLALEEFFQLHSQTTIRLV